MDWKLIASTFMLVLFAEFGDKTQLAAISLAATMRQPFAIAAGAIGGLAVGTIFAVAVGWCSGTCCPPSGSAAVRVFISRVPAC